MDYTIKLPRFVKRRLGEPFYTNLLLVNSYAAAARKNQVLHFARYFRREFKYDFVQFGGPSENENDFEAWLFFEDRSSYEEIPIGACCFRHRKYTDHHHWGLQWIWLHPYFRSQGILKNNFPFFVDRYGSFVPEPPLSKSMEAFASKYCPVKANEMIDFPPEFNESFKNPEDFFA